MKANEAPEQYISKSALVAEIEKWRDRITKGIFSIPLTGHDRACATFEYEILGNVKDFLDTFKTKDVDLEHLEQEVEDFCYEYDDKKEKWYELCPNDRKLLYNPTWANFAMSIAKHFFELGMQVSNKQQKGE